MGMYTELVLKCSIKKDCPQQVVDILNKLFNGAEYSGELPKHPFFSCERWDHVGSSHSFYHIPWHDSKYEKDYIFSRCDLKNYEDEIENFLDWVRPYIYEPSGTCIGWKWYETDGEPTLLYNFTPELQKRLDDIVEDINKNVRTDDLI